MNIVSKRALGKPLSFISANEKINVLITNSNNGPNILLEDGSTVQFTNLLQYYNVITDPSIYNIDNQTFNVEAFQEKYLTDSDDVDRMDISEVEEYTIDDTNLFRFIAG